MKKLIIAISALVLLLSANLSSASPNTSQDVNVDNLTQAGKSIFDFPVFSDFEIEDVGLIDGDFITGTV